MKHAVVLGAGIQGACAALALVQEGYRVTLVDRAAQALDRASLRNAGKIHLGFVYANDPSMRTSFLMLESALEFASLVDGFVGREIDWRKLKSRPVVYYVVHDSLLSRSCVSEHYERIHTRFGLCHRLDTGPPRYVTTLGVLETGVTDAGLAEFWAQALRKLRKLRFDDAQRRDIARQMLRKGAPLPQQPTWPGAAAGAWGDVLAELAALVRNQDLAA